MIDHSVRLCSTWRLSLEGYMLCYVQLMVQHSSTLRTVGLNAVFVRSSEALTVTYEKLGSYCRDCKLQFSGPNLRSLGNFSVGLEHSCCVLSAEKACTWNIRPDNKSSISILQSWPTYRKAFVSEDHNHARIPE